MALSPTDKRIALRLAAAVDPTVVRDPRDPFYHLDDYPALFHEFRMKCFWTKISMEKVLRDFDEEVKESRRKARDSRDFTELAYVKILLQGRASDLQKRGKAQGNAGLIALGKELHKIADKQYQADLDLLKDVLKPR